MQKNCIFVLLIALLYVMPCTVAAQKLAEHYNLSRKSAFTENKGQVTDQHGNLRNDVKYLYAAPGLKLVMKSNSFSYEVFTLEKKNKQEFSEATGSQTVDRSVSSPFQGGGRGGFKEPEEVTIKTHRIDISFIGANLNPEIIAEEKSSDYNNYYLAHTPEEGIRNVYSYTKLTYKNLYPKIDLVFYAREEGKLKYDIVVHPGGKLEDVKMNYNGADGLALAEGKLTLKTALGEIEEQIPYSFLEENKQAVYVKHVLKAGQLSFSGNYDNSKTLVIDPTLIWGTYYGGSGDDLCSRISIDGNGNVYITGRAGSTSGIATTGTHQTSLGGSVDALVVKFNGSGVRQWGTYYGGSGDDASSGISTDGSGNIFIAGTSTSTSGISTTGAHQTSPGGGYEAYVVKFNSSGVRQWGTYYGGSGADYGQGISTDGSGNVFITGLTASTSGIATTGAHQTSPGGGYEAYVVKFNSSGVRQWGTYYGGSNIDYGFGICTDGSGNVYVTGYTRSGSGIATTGAHQTIYGGGYDAFVVKFNSSGVRQWGTYYGGGGVYNESYDISIDGSGNIYITGYTNSTSGIATTGAHQTSNGGGNSDAYVVKFNSSGVRQWATYYGGSDNDFGRGISTDDSGNVFITGETKSTSGIATTGAHQTTNGGYYDAFVVKFNSSGVRQWATYYGGSDNEYGWGISTDGSANIYITGYTNGTSGIATTGAHQTTNGGYYDAFVVKFSDNPCTITASSLTGNTNNCSGSNQSYTANKGTGLSYSWSVTGGIITSVKSTDSISVTWGSAGSGSVKVVVSSSSFSCKDSVTKSITIAALPNATVGVAKTICFGQSTGIGDTAVSGNTYSWSSKPAGFTDTSSNPTVSPTGTTTYYLTETITATTCKKTDSVLITVNPSIGNNTVSSSQTICSGQAPLAFTGSAVTGGAGTGTYNYEWQDSAAGNNWRTVDTNADYSAGVITNNGSGDSLIYFRRIVTSAECTGAQSSISNIITVRIHSPLRNNTINPVQAICSGEVPAVLTGDTVTGGTGIYQYQWQDSTSGSQWRSIATTANFASAAIINSSHTTDSVIYFRRIVTSGACSSNEASESNIITIIVHPRPAPVITGDTILCAKSVAIYSVNLDSGSTATWVVTGGNIIAGQGTGTITVDWPAVDTGVVKVIVMNKTACKDSDSQNLIINPLPVANFAATSVCFGDSTTFTDSSEMAVSHLWIFGDRDSSVLAEPVHLYKLPGQYQAQLIVTSVSGCLDTITKIVIVDSLPVAAFNVGNTCFGDSTNFTFSNTTASNYLWIFGDSDSSAIANPSHKYSLPGTYQVKLKVWNSAGCVDSVSKDVTINPLPVTSIAVNKDTSSIRTYTLSSSTNASLYLWGFGDGTFDSGKIVIHTFPKDSTYKITLAVIDSNGCSSAKDTTITVQTVGISETIMPAFNLKLYPNPFTNALTVEYALPQRERVDISIHDLTGKEIGHLFQGVQEQGKYSYAIDAAYYNLRSGIYLIRMVVGNQTVNKQIIKLK